MSRRLRAPGEGFVNGAGVPILIEESHALPMVDIEIAFRTGSYADPEGKDGLARFLARMVRMGTKKQKGADVEERIARLGARLGVEVSGSSVRYQGTVIRKNLGPFVALLGELIAAPALRATDLAHVKRETLSDLIGMRDHDETLAARAFRDVLFADHPYGRSIAGTTATVRRIRRQDLIDQHQRSYLLGNMVVGAAGDVTQDELGALVDAHLLGLPKGRTPRLALPKPSVTKGLRLRIVDKPERTQTQLYVGSLGAKLGDPLTFPVHVGNAGFGGMFTGRLMQEVRAARGLSYGASSRRDIHRQAFVIHTFPSASDAVACTELVLELLEDFVQKGLTDAEVKAAKSFLVRGHCFEVDTAAKRLDARLDIELYGLPPEQYTDYPRLVESASPAEVRQAVRRRLSSRDLAITIVATAKDVQASLERLPGLTDMSVVPYDRV
jgi:zinc protease